VNASYNPAAPERLSVEDLAELRAQLRARGLKLGDGSEMEQKLHDLRLKYEPYVQGIARNLYIPLPSWIRHDTIRDNWQAGPWDRMIQAEALGRITRERRAAAADDHF
jgi:hypothetical protein